VAKGTLLASIVVDGFELIAAIDFDIRLFFTNFA
jgi:hypothetical protein